MLDLPPNRTMFLYNNSIIHRLPSLSLILTLKLLTRSRTVDKYWEKSTEDTSILLIHLRQVNSNKEGTTLEGKITRFL